MSKTRWDETWHRLLEWTNGQAQSERLSAQVIAAEGYASIDPSHPLGGKDGGRDARCTKDGKRYVMASYFPRGEKPFKEILEKLHVDMRRVAEHGAVGIVFVTNQEIRLAEREAMCGLALPLTLDLFHLERMTTILDRPDMQSVRHQFLGIGDDAGNTFILGGQGGQAPGAGGGGGGVIGWGARGGDGGPGGKFVLDGQPGEAPGAGGGGGGVIAVPTREIESADLANGLHLSALYLVDSAQIRDGMLFVLGGGWEHCEISNLPVDAQWWLVCTMSLGNAALGTLLEFFVEVVDPVGALVERQRAVIGIDGARPVARPSSVIGLRFSISRIGVWSLRVVSGSVVLGTLPIEIRLRSQ